ncbi:MULTISPECIES: TIGR04197 family type VII secretion effector [Clostridium]|uniref:Uncharacterized protein n=1 Tax=Clostridium paraputrificum TaxID=29363 RepID=A0A6N2YZ72_9CLOT|nr:MULTISPECIES: TIGR04197 family type VII secretion effector [Clostridium]MBS5927392.1 TIGR04197 family type VII secretion effector [Clostridium sp.]MBS5987295.1 TIGR04197 family type VII secretion effector [Clostridium sp.]MDB2094266.1 TIGR04197 family type VII secretion effector [Clostridium paraputrificum]MDB2104751.1 TIGR04197 family type VII secretion effector [Clostridium paraputrificum]MDB2118393.1 TIGR04197 family type VII secretion effector [Clostridium paraputrificum]
MGDIKIDFKEYEKVIRKLEKANERSIENNKGILFAPKNSSIECIDKYSEAIGKIKLILSEYSKLLNKDISNFIEIGKLFAETDENIKNNLKK